MVGTIDMLREKFAKPTDVDFCWQSALDDEAIKTAMAAKASWQRWWSSKAAASRMAAMLSGCMGPATPPSPVDDWSMLARCALFSFTTD
jgi:hypothetical protein